MATFFGDLGNAIIIIIVFILLQFVVNISIGIQNIKRNWDLYKCNPAVMPFATVFGYDAKANFNECIKTTQTDFMTTFLDPIYGSISYFAETGGIFTGLFEDLKIFGNSEKSTMDDFEFDNSNRLNNIITAVNETFAATGAAVGQFVSLFTNLSNSVNSLLIGAKLSVYQESAMSTGSEVVTGESSVDPKATGVILDSLDYGTTGTGSAGGGVGGGGDGSPSNAEVANCEAVLAQRSASNG